MKANRKKAAAKPRTKRKTDLIDWDRLQHDIGQVLDISTLARKAGVQERLIRESQAGKPKTPSKIAAIVNATSVRDPKSYVFSIHKGKSEAQLKIGSSLKGWEIKKFIGGDVVRDISFKVGVVVDKKAGRVGRCKVFDLDFDIESREFIDAELVRNPTICHLVERDNAFPILYEHGFATKDKYWVVESWEEAETLQDLVNERRIAKESIPKIARDLASALLALNNNRVFVRCLSPKMVCLRTDGSLLLRDFEMATFLGPTASGKITEHRNVYYAHEFDQPDIDHRADMYSWAQVVLFCLTGRRPPSNQDEAFLASLPIPKNVMSILKACSMLNRDHRLWDLKRGKNPFDFSDVLADLEGWV
ncbi:hypothetical protein N9L06_00320 [Mariniblastus sp.]|nr:hypothetical protein [Mariniblastus sp.]